MAGTFEEVERRGIAMLSKEAEMFVPLKTKTLYDRYYQGRLIARGSPLTVEISHLREQFLNNFPLVNQEELEPTT